MELIIKPTSKCNFACTFCSASKMNLQTLDHLNDDLKKILDTLKPTNIIITGGDPLCVSPDFYYELLSYGNWNISLTTNLKDFVLNPTKWIDLFRNPRIGICTSFQYGDGRRWSTDVVYDEQMFIDTETKFKELIGYTPNFISVISTENEQYALKHCKLAKLLQTRCKLNSVMPLGSSIEHYPMYKMFKIWFDAIEQGYQDYIQVDSCFKNGACNLNTALLCTSTIRSVAFKDDGTILYSHCEDDLAKEEYIQQDIAAIIPAKERIPFNQHITKSCVFCRLFYICHGCKHMRKLNTTLPEHCSEMKKLEEKICSSQLFRLQP